MADKELDLETMPLADLRALALAEGDKEIPKEQPKAKAVPLPEEEMDAKDTPIEDEPDEFIYKKEIDLEDGSGIQVFTGRGATKVEALENLNEKLVESQRNATKKIKELNSKVKVQPPPEKTFSDDEEYVYSQQLQKKPTEGFKQLFREVTGVDVSDFKTQSEALKEFNRIQASQAVQLDFVTTHSDYEAIPENATKIQGWVKGHNYTDYTAENLEEAYQDLKKSGLLKLKTSDSGADTEVETKAVERIVQPKVEATQTRSQRKSSTISTRGSGAPAVKTGPTEDELYSMPKEQLRKLANEQLAAGRE
jgi:hypothetical protein